MISPVPWDDGLLLVTDLGGDAVYAYRLDPTDGDLTLAGRTAMPSGSGPRHFAFHLAEPFVYVLCELDCTLVTCAWDRATGQLTTLARNSVVSRNGPASAAGEATPRENTASAIRTSPDGRFLYAACRGPDTITMFRLTDAVAPERAGIVASGGACPRDIALAADGRLLLCANQESDTVTVFRIAQGTGMPIRTEAMLTVPAPACIQAY
jgi:6-phosphogluconolactonase